jgi:hypothetical protein
MKKFFLLTLLLAFAFTSCGTPKTAHRGNAQEILSEILENFEQGDGFVYTDEAGAEYPLTDTMLARMFPDDGDTADLFCVVSAAVYFSRRFSDREILVLEICDISHTELIVRLLQKRAKKKENAVVFADGVYVYLICTDMNEEISRYLQR